MDLTDTSMTFAATPPVEGFRFSISSLMAMTGEREERTRRVGHCILRHLECALSLASPQKGRDSECKVMHHAHQEWPCLTVQCMERKTPCFDLYCERTMEKLDYSVGVSTRVCTDVQCQGHQSAQTWRRLCDTCNTDSLCEFKEQLSKHLFVKHIATLGPRPQLLDS